MCNEDIKSRISYSRQLLPLNDEALLKRQVKTAGVAS